ncbi:unnamed protein product [Urochloa humidicola]
MGVPLRPCQRQTSVGRRRPPARPRWEAPTRSLAADPVRPLLSSSARLRPPTAWARACRWRTPSTRAHACRPGLALAGDGPRTAAPELAIGPPPARGLGPPSSVVDPGHPRSRLPTKAHAARAAPARPSPPPASPPPPPPPPPPASPGRPPALARSRHRQAALLCVPACRR